MMFSVRGHSHEIEKVFMCMNILKPPKHTKTATFSQEISNFSKTELSTIFSNLSNVGQNQNSGLHAKKSGVIFF